MISKLDNKEKRKIAYLVIVPKLAFSLRSLVLDFPVVRFFQPSADLLAPEVTRGRCGGSMVVFSEITGSSTLR